jgi:hypothetical protein
LVGEAAFTDQKSVGDQFWRPILSVTVSPVGKGLSRPTFDLPTIITFPTNLFFPTNYPTPYTFANQQFVGPIVN